MPLPQSAAQELTERVNNLLARHAPPSAFELRLIEREAKNLMGVDAAIAYQTLGIVAAMNGDVEQAKSNHQHAIRLRPGDVLAIINYAISLLRLGYPAEAFCESARAAQIAPHDYKVLSECLDYAMRAGLFVEAAKCVSRIEQKHQLLEQDEAHAGILECAADIQRSRDLPDDWASTVIGVTVGVQREHGIYSTAIALGSCQDDESCWLAYEIYTWCDAETVCRLNDALLDKLVERKLPVEHVTALVPRFVQGPADVDNSRRLV